MPKSPEQFFAKKEEESKETPQTEKERRALELLKEIKQIESKPEEEKTIEDYKRIIELNKKIEKIFLVQLAEVYFFIFNRIQYILDMP